MNKHTSALWGQPNIQHPGFDGGASIGNPAESNLMERREICIWLHEECERGVAKCGQPMPLP